VFSFGVMMAGIAGALSWLLITAYGARHVAWDSPLYYLAAMPALALMSSALAYLNPERPWRYALAPYAGQAAAGLAVSPIGDVLPLGIFLFPLLSLPGMVLAYLAAALKAGLQIRIPKPGKRIRITDKSIRKQKLDELMQELERESRSGRTDPEEESRGRLQPRAAPTGQKPPPRQR
jgi:hypothetical protein